MAGSAGKPTRRGFTNSGWFLTVLALGNGVMAFGFLWAVFDGWEAMPRAVAIPFGLACGVVIVGNAVAVIETKRGRH